MTTSNIDTLVTTLLPFLPGCTKLEMVFDTRMKGTIAKTYELIMIRNTNT